MSQLTIPIITNATCATCGERADHWHAGDEQHFCASHVPLTPVPAHPRGGNIEPYADTHEPEEPRRRTYRERRLARADRLDGWAEGRAAKAQAASDRAHELGAGNPMGQPILVGHHSQRRHERDAARIDSAMSATVEHSRKAEQHQRRAASIRAQADRAIYSDDADAVERLRERIVALEAERDARKPGIAAYNKSARKGQPDPSVLHPKDRRDLEHPALRGFITRPNGTLYPGRLANLTADIARNKKRLAELEGGVR